MSEEKMKIISNCVIFGGNCDTVVGVANATAETYYQRDKTSRFEDKYLKLIIDSINKTSLKEFYKTIGSKNFTLQEYFYCFFFSALTEKRLYFKCSL